MIGLLETVAIFALPLIAAVVLHEVAHGYVAYLRGDHTAKALGRLTLNPLAHVDPVGTIGLPLFLFAFSKLTGSPLFLIGYAKPVPVDFRNLPNPRRDMALVAAAGPVTNLILAVASAALFKTMQAAFPRSAEAVMLLNHGASSHSGDPILVPIMYMLLFSVFINVALMVLNLIPILPLDGGRIVTGLLPRSMVGWYAAIDERVGLGLLLFILFVNPFGIVDHTIFPLMRTITDLLL
ncbi:MAG: site-2 protease family protein [Nitrospinae bacterium]|nr:site-2 protease family protein [Nitrospinota bacterium]